MTLPTLAYRDPALALPSECIASKWPSSPRIERSASTRVSQAQRFRCYCTANGERLRASHVAWHNGGRGLNIDGVRFCIAYMRTLGHVCATESAVRHHHGGLRRWKKMLWAHSAFLAT